MKPRVGRRMLILLTALLAVVVTFGAVPSGPARACHDHPINLKAEVREDGSVHLTWSPPDHYPGRQLYGHNVYRMDKTTGVTEKLNASLVQGGSYVDSTALPGRTYKYWVKAVFNDGESDVSNKCYVEIPGTAGWGGAMGPPQNLKASLVEGHVVLTWDPPATGAENVFGYYVYRKDSEYGFDGQPLNDFAVTSCTWTDRTVQAGVTYWYHVTAVDRDENQSPPSEWVEVSTSELVIILTIDDHTALVNGQPVIMDQPPIIIDGRAMLPFRFISETMGIAVDWYEDTRQVVATYGGTVVVFTIGSQTAYVNGQPRLTNVPPQIVNGRTLIPLRFLANGLGWPVDWDSETRSVTIRIDLTG